MHSTAQFVLNRRQLQFSGLSEFKPKFVIIGRKFFLHRLGV